MFAKERRLNLLLQARWLPALLREAEAPLHLERALASERGHLGSGLRSPLILWGVPSHLEYEGVEFNGVQWPFWF